MTKYALTVFDTAFGKAGVAWGDAGVRASAFPGGDEAATRAVLRRRAPGAIDAEPDAKIRRLTDDIAAVFGGARRDFAAITLDDGDLPAFDRAVWAETLKIPAGETRTYGEIARAVGDVRESRRVGQALGRNPFPVIVPCHRVVGVDGRMTGFSAPGGAEAKRRLLKLEGALAPELFD